MHTHTLTIFLCDHQSLSQAAERKPERLFDVRHRSDRLSGAKKAARLSTDSRRSRKKVMTREKSERETQTDKRKGREKSIL